MNTAVQRLEDEVRQLVRQRGVDPQRDPEGAKNLIGEVITDYDLRSLRGSVPRLEDVERWQNAARPHHRVRPAAALPRRRLHREIWINEPSLVFVSRSGAAELTNTILTEDEVRDLVERMLRTSGRRLDLSSPFVDASLPTGERLHVVIPDVTRRHWAVNIRKYVARAHSTADLVTLGSLTSEAAAFLDSAVIAGLNVLVSGATNAGKTTMVNALAGAIPSSEHVITCEEVFELNLFARDSVAMQCRSANLEGKGEVPLRKLVKEALRMRPDRIIIGEVREAEALDLLIALNSGIPGMTTIHANSAREAITKICTLPLLAGQNITDRFVVPTVASAIDIVVHLGLDRSGRRLTKEVLALSGRVEGAVIEATPMFVHDGEALVATGAPAPHLDNGSRTVTDVAELTGRGR